jgi:spore maturation protein CgeB
MMAEKSTEHDEAFHDGIEYIGYRSSDDLCRKAIKLLLDDRARNALGQSGRKRAIHSGYSTVDRARQMISEILK